MELLTHIATVKQMYAAYRHSLRGALVAAPFFVAGGVMLGKLGFFLGGAVGGWLGKKISEDVRPVPQVLMELPAAEKVKLSAETMAVVKNLDWKDAAELINFVMSNSVIRDKVLEVLTTYITNELKAGVKYGK